MKTRSPFMLLLLTASLGPAGLAAAADQPPKLPAVVVRSVGQAYVPAPPSLGLPNGLITSAELGELGFDNLPAEIRDGLEVYARSWVSRDEVVAIVLAMRGKYRPEGNDFADGFASSAEGNGWTPFSVEGVGSAVGFTSTAGEADPAMASVAFSRGDLMFMVIAVGGDRRGAVAQREGARIARLQHARATETSFLPPEPGPSIAYMLGRIMGPILLIGVPVAVIRARRRRKAGMASQATFFDQREPPA